MSVINQTINCIALLAIVGCAGDPIEDRQGKPDIVEIFACGDYCPGPEEKYLKRVYDGVTEEHQCRELGGRLHTYFAWGWYTVCMVK